MKITICIVSAIALALLISPAFAYSSLNGPTGTANLPTAEIAKGGLDISFDSQGVQGIVEEIPADVNHTTDVGPLFKSEDINAQIWRGAYGLSKSIELSGDYVATSRTTRGLSVKYLLNGDGVNQNAVGFVYGTTSALPLPLMGITSTRADGDGGTLPPPVINLPKGMEMMFNRVNTTQVYFAHTKTIIAEGYKKPALVGTVGLNYTDMTFRDGVGRAFGSLQVKYMNNVLALDYQTLNTTIEGHAMRSLVLRREFQSGLGVELGWTNSMGMLGGSVDRFFFGSDLAINL